MNINAFVMKLGILLLSLLIFAGCGTNNSQSLPSTAPINPDENASVSVASLSIRNGNSVTVSRSEESVTIEVRALTKSNMLAPSGTVLATYLEANSTVDGDLAVTSAAIENGVATFVYKAPKDLQNQIDAGNTGTSFRFYSAEDTSISTVVSIVFDTKADTGGSDPISAIVLSSYVISVDEPKETVTIEVTAKKSDGSYVANAKVGLKQLTQTGAVDVGTTDSEAVITNGKGSFTYTAPLNINNATSVSPVQFQVCDKVNTDVCQVFNVTIASATTATPRLTVSPGSKTLTQNAEAVSVTVLATDSAGLALQSGTIEVLNPVGASVGYFTETEKEIVNGVSTFNYVGPNPLYSGYASFTFRFKENPTYKATWNVTFSPSTGVSVDPIRALATDGNVTVNTAGETKTIKVTAFTNGNALAQTGTVSVVYPSASGSIGTFSPAQAEVDNGVATFTYTAPTPLVNAPDQTFTFRADSGVTTQLKVSYVPQASVTNPVAQTLVILNGNDVNITKNGEVVNLRIRVYGVDNNPFDGGNVKIQFPDVAVTGTDVGSFSALSVPCVNGVADFTYNAPSNITGRSDTFSFTFYHDSEASPAQATWNVRMLPDPGQIVITTYELNLIPSDGNLTMGLESVKSFTAKVTDEDGKEINEGNYTISTMNPLYGVLLDASGTIQNPLVENNEKNIVFRLQSNTKSGVVPLRVNVSFIDINGVLQTIEQVYNIVVYSGPPTAMSISYVGTDQKAENSQFVEIFSVKLTDKYNNPVNTRPMIQVGAIAGYTKDPSVYASIKSAVDATRNGVDTPIPVGAHFLLSGLYNGNLIALRDDADLANYSATQSRAVIGNTINYDTSAIDAYNDTLVTFGDGYTYHKSGKWDIDSVDSGTDTLILNEQYVNASVGFDMGFAIGNNYRQDTCRFGEEWVLTTESDDGTYQVDEQGYARVRMPYDYYLTGKDVIVYANLIGDVLGAPSITTRVGEGKKVTLRGHELTPVPKAYTIPAGSALTPGYIFEWRLKDTVEWFRNGNFGGYEVKVSGEGAYCTNPVVNDYRNCENGGVAYISYSCAGGAEDGTVTMSDGVVSTELKY